MKTKTEEATGTVFKICRCCGKEVRGLIEATDPHPIHTACIPKHWQNHANGINSGRCREFRRSTKRMPCGGLTWAGAMR